MGHSRCEAEDAAHKCHAESGPLHSSRSLPGGTERPVRALLSTRTFTGRGHFPPEFTLTGEPGIVSLVGPVTTHQQGKDKLDAPATDQRPSRWGLSPARVVAGQAAWWAFSPGPFPGRAPRGAFGSRTHLTILVLIPQ